MGIVLLIVVLVVGYVLFKRYSGGGDDDLFGIRRRSSVDIARERYAKGEIDREEFERIKEDLND